jgi:hypothetical protein
MQLNQILREISNDGSLEVETLENEFSISTDRDRRILRIYPGNKTAEFLDIEDEWDELKWALDEKYSEYPGLKILVEYLNDKFYDITW